MPTSSEPSSRARWCAWLRALALIAVLALAVRQLYRSPYSASDLRVTPDEVEYAVCARRLATLGRYDMDFDGVSVPPHSTPWFSAMLAPIYYVAPREIGNGILLVLAFSVAGLVALQRVAERVAGPLAAALAVIAVLAAQPYAYTARHIMTDAPAAALGIAVCLLHLRARERGQRVRDSLIAGALAAAAFALRSVYLSLLIPFAWVAWRQREHRVRHAIALLAPLACVLAANALYNESAFGDWRRTGYQFWCAVPYDYPELLLSGRYLRDNLADMATGYGPPSLALGVIGVALLLWRARARSLPLLAFVAVTALPITALHLLYFYADLRFHVFTLLWCAALGGMGAANLLPQRLRSSRALALLVLVAAAIALPLPRDVPQVRRATADAIHDATRDGCIVISGLEPVYLTAVAPPGSTRTYVAASRDVEFASKLLSYERVDRSRANPRDAYDHRASGLAASGAREAIARTADEMPGQIAAWVREGRDVFLDRSFVFDPAAVPRILGRELRLEPPQARLARVVLAR